MNTDNDRIKRIEDFLLDPERALFTTLEEFRTAVDEMLPVIKAIDIANLQTLKGEDGKTPVRGTDYMTQEDIDALEAFILSKMPVTDVDYPSVQATEAFINFQIAKIPRIKGDRGIDGVKGVKGNDGSPDTAEEILKKLRTLGRNQGLQIDDIRGLENRIKFYNTAVDQLAQLREDFDNQRFVLPTLLGGGGSSPGANQNYVTDAQLIIINNTSGINTGDQVGDGTTILGAGTPADPFIAVAAVGSVAWGAITGTLSNQLDLQAALDGKAPSLTADQNYVTDAQLVVITNTSGVNTGDNTNFAPPLGANDNYVTDAQLVVIGNTTGTNTGDQNLSNYLTFTGVETASNKTLTAPIINAGTIGTSLVPTTNDGAALGSTTNQFSDLFLAEGGVINWDNSDATLTQVNNVITMAGADLRATTNGTNAASVVTVGGVQTLDNKTLTGATNVLTASFLKSATTEVNVSSATAPTSGQVLTATSSTTATWQTVSGTGDVVGPASAVNNRVVFFDGTTGKLIKDSGLTLSGSNTGDQTSIVGITGTIAQFNTAITDGDLATGGGTATGTNTGDQNLSGYVPYTGATGNVDIGAHTFASTAINIGGSDTTSFHVNSSGDMWLGDATFALGKFKVTAAGITNITGAAGTNRQIGGQTGSVQRNKIILANDIAETGSNAGSNFQIITCDDTGLDTFVPVSIERKTANIVISGNGLTLPHASSMMEFQSTTKGVRFSNMTTTQRNAITPGAGTVIYDTTTGRLNVYSTSWQVLNGDERVITTTDDSTSVIDVTITDVYELTAMANATTFSTTGTPRDGQVINIRFKDNGTSRALTWDAIFVPIGVTMPTATVIGKWHYVSARYNANAVKFHVLAVAVQA